MSSSLVSIWRDRTTLLAVKSEAWKTKKTMSPDFRLLGFFCPSKTFVLVLSSSTVHYCTVYCTVCMMPRDRWKLSYNFMIFYVICSISFFLDCNRMTCSMCSILLLPLMQRGHRPPIQRWPPKTIRSVTFPKIRAISITPPAQPFYNTICIHNVPNTGINRDKVKLFCKVL